MAPIFLSSVLTVGVISYLLIKSSEELFDQYAKAHAFEYVESFLIATEVSGSRANIIRVTNSLGTYSDIEEFFVIDNDSKTILASNKNKFTGKSLAVLPERYPVDEILNLHNSGERYYQALTNNTYVLGYRARIVSEDHRSQKSITLILLTSPNSISLFFDKFKADIFTHSVFIFVLSLVLFYILIQVILLRPIKRIITVLSKEQGNGKPNLCAVETNDELGTLAETYNIMMLDRYNKRQKLISANKTLEELNQHDALTGISNRRNFDQVLHKEWHRSIRNHEMISLVMIDIDYFKQFNDTYGHLAGDDCLKIVAKSLNTNINRPGDLVSRYGGEEFVIILPHSNEQAWELAELCRREIESLVIFKDENDKPVQITISLGLANIVPLKGQHYDVLIKAADMALYQAKAAGRNKVIVHDLQSTVSENSFKDNSNVMPFKKKE